MHCISNRLACQVGRSKSNRCAGEQVSSIALQLGEAEFTIKRGYHRQERMLVMEHCIDTAGLSSA